MPPRTRSAHQVDRGAPREPTPLSTTRGATVRPSLIVPISEAFYLQLPQDQHCQLVRALIAIACSRHLRMRAGVS